MIVARHAAKVVPEPFVGKEILVGCLNSSIASSLRRFAPTGAPSGSESPLRTWSLDRLDLPWRIAVRDGSTRPFHNSWTPA